jgi:putative membrane protein
MPLIISLVIIVVGFGIVWILVGAKREMEKDKTAPAAYRHSSYPSQKPPGATEGGPEGLLENSKEASMGTLSKFSTAILGAIIVAAGLVPFWWATQVISEGNKFYGFGWENSSISQGAAAMYQAVGIAGLVFGGIILLIGLVVALRRKPAVTPLGASMTSNSKALEIAKERYAKGEISNEDFERIRKNLG